MDKVIREIKRLPDDYRTPSGFKIAAGYVLWVDGKIDQVGSRESLLKYINKAEKEEREMKIRKMGSIAVEMFKIVGKAAMYAGVVLVVGFVALEVLMYIAGGILANSYGR